METKDRLLATSKPKKVLNSEFFRDSKNFDKKKNIKSMNKESLAAWIKNVRFKCTSNIQCDIYFTNVRELVFIFKVIDRWMIDCNSGMTVKYLNLKKL